MQRVLRSQADFAKTLIRNQLTSLVIYEAITTTGAKAAALLPVANRFFNQVKDADLSAYKLAHRTLLSKTAIRKVFEEILPRYAKEETTFVSGHRLTPRRSDSSPQTLVRLIKLLEIEPEKKTVDNNSQPKLEPKLETGKKTNNE